MNQYYTSVFCRAAVKARGYRHVFLLYYSSPNAAEPRKTGDAASWLKQ